MAPIRLNLSALRSSLSRREHLPDAPSRDRTLGGLLAERPVSRRTAIQVTGGAVAGLVPALNHLHAFLGGLELVGDDRRLAFLLGGRERWVIDVRRFAGSPTLRHRKRGDGVRVELRGARFPGTALPADFMCDVSPGIIGHRMRLKFALGGFHSEAPFEGWLRGTASARSRVSFDERVCPLGRRSSLQLAGRAEAEFSPDWTITLNGRGVVRVPGIGGEVRSDSVTLALADAEAPSVLGEPPERRTLISLERQGRPWALQPKLPLEGPGDLQFSDDPFDGLTIEAGETARGRVVRALVATCAAGGQTAFYAPGGGLVDDSGRAARIPLRDARYAVAFDRSGERRALLAEYGEAAWLSGDGFNIEVGATPDAGPFELVATNRTVERMRCEPPLLRIAVPMAGALVEPVELPAGSRIALAQSMIGDDDEPVTPARLCFDDDRRCTGLTLAPAPPLAVLRPDDLLSVTFQFVNLGLQIEGGGQASLVREPAQEAPGSFVIVYFAPQNIAEQAFWERARDAAGGAVSFEQLDSQGGELDEGDPGYEKSPNSSEEPDAGDVPVRARIAGRSRLAFRLPDEVDSLPYTLGALLDWSRLEPSLVATALPPPPPPPRLLVRRLAVPGRTTTTVARAQIATAVTRPIKTEVQVDAARQSAVARELGKNLPRRVRVPDERLEAIAATLIQTRPGYRAVPSAGLSAIIAKLLSRPYAPGRYETHLETPWRLVVSPNRFGSWAHSVQEVSDPDTGITELWHTRLGVRRAGEIPPGASPVDEEEDYFRTLRAVWSPDYLRDASSDDPPRYPETHPGNPFRSSLDARDRHELVTLTSDFTLPDCEERIVRVERLMLSALGAWMNVRGAWELSGLPAEALNLLSVEEWRHRATMGRDHYVRVVYRGYLFPLGHRASLVKVTERKFKQTKRGQTAFLRQRMYVVVRQPERAFPAAFEPHAGRKFPFRRVRLATLATPSLDDPAEGQILGKGQGAFWLRVNDEDFPFHIVAEDLEGRRVEFTASLAFVDSKYAVDFAVADAAAASLAGSPRRSARPVSGQKVAYAESVKAGDTTFETDSLTLGAQAVAEPGDAAFRAQDQPRFFPAVDGASVELPAVKQLVGVAGGVAIRYPARYLERGFEGAANDPSGNAGQVFAELASPADLSFGGGSAGTDKVGGLVTPNLSISGLSRLSGPVSGDLEEMMSGSFDPAKFFAGLDVKLLGGLSLLDIVEALTGFGAQLDGLKADMDSLLGDLTEQATAAALDSLPKCQVPAFITQLIYDAADAASDLGNAAKLPKQVQLTFKWDPRVTSSGPFVVNGDPDDTLSLTSIALIPLGLDGPAKEPSYTVSAALDDFTLNLFNIIAIQVNSVRFKKQAGEKPDVKADIENVEFQGPLAFVENLQSLIPSNGFVDASIDVTPLGIKAGFNLALPTIAVGVLTIDNISLGGGLSVPFTGDPLRFRFNFCTREQPFVLTVYALGGGGFFGIELGLDGVELLEAALEFGAAIAVDFGVASGGVSVKAGIYFKMEVDVATLTGYFRMNGYIDVLGLITASIVFYLALTYQSSPKMVWGEATLTIEVEVLFFSVSVDIKARKEFATPPPPRFADLMNEDEWVTYQLAFAE